MRHEQGNHAPWLGRSLNDRFPGLAAVLVGGLGLFQPYAQAATVFEDFSSDPVAAGRFTMQTVGTESRFQFNPADGSLANVLDVDAATAYYLSAPFPPITDRDTVSFSFSFRVDGFDDRVPPTSFIGLMTPQHVENFGDGLTVNLATSGGQLIATASIDNAGFKSEGTEIPLVVQTQYVAYRIYSAITRKLAVELFSGTNFTNHVGRSEAMLPAGRPLSMGNLGIQNGGARITDFTTGSITLSVDDLATPGLPPVSVSVADVTVSEGTGGGGSVALQVLLTVPNTVPVNVDYRTVDGSALAGADYVPTMGTLVIPAGATGARLLIPIIPDALGETNETFRLVLSNPVNANLAGPEAIITLVDDDLPQIGAGEVVAVEGQIGLVNALLPLRLSNPSTQTVSVNFATTDGTATGGPDYLGANGVVVFPPGITNQTIRLTLLGDTIAEGNETFALQLSAPVNAVLGKSAGEVTILDDDPAPGISISDAAIQEGQAGPRNAAVTVRLANASALKVTVDFATADGTTSAGLDYLSRNGTLVFDPGETEKSLTVTILGDTAPEEDETVALTLSQPVNATLRDGTALVTILDDDRVPRVQAAAAEIVEGPAGSTAQMVFDIRLSSPSANVVTVNFATVGGTATAGVDFVSTTGVMIFEPGVSHQQVVVTIVGDDAAEPDENLFLLLSSPLNATLTDTEAAGAILTDDGVTFSIAEVEITEGDTGDSQAVFLVRLTGTPTQPVTVSYFTANGTASAGLDYRARSGLLTFQPGQTLQTISIAIIGDALDEPDENFRVNLTGPAGASLSKSTAVGKIRDNDPPSISVNSVQVVEGSAGPTRVRFLVRLSSATFEETQVKYLVEARTATAGLDFLPGFGSLVFPAGAEELPIDVVVLGDTIDEPDETFVVRLINPVGVTLAVAEGVGTIKDDDEAPRIRIGDLEVTECSGGTAEAVFPVTLSTASEQTVTVNYSTADGTATAGSDYLAISGTITFPPGTTSQQVRVTLLCDQRDEPNEFFSVFLGGSVNGFIDGGGGRGNITDDDPPALSVADVAVREGNAGITNAVFQVQLSSAAADLVTVAFETADGTATAGSDYATVSGLVSFPPGITRQEVSVPLIGDTLPEANETFRVLLANPFNASLAWNEASGTILDDDQPEIRLEDITVVEGDSSRLTATIPVRLSHSSTQPVLVQYATTSGTATEGLDFLVTTGALLFAPGEVLAQVPVTVLGDALVEGNEVFFITFRNPENGLLPVLQASVTIVDNDGAPVISVADESIDEGNAGPRNLVFSLRLSAVSTQPISVAYATANATATAGSDYVARNGTASFAPGTTNLTLAVPVLGDTAFEPDETFLLVLTNPANAVLARNQALGHIRNDDQPSVLAVDDAFVPEGRPATRTNLVFRVTLNPPNNTSVSVAYASVPGTATAGADFESTAGTLTFPAGSTSQLVNVAVLGDAETEPDETVRLRLSEPVNANLGRGEAIGTIIDDDGVGIRISDASVREPDLGTVSLVFTVTLAKPASQLVTVGYTTADGSATAGADYNAVAGTLSFPPGLTSQTLTVAVRGDLVDEPDESFDVRLANPVNGGLDRTAGRGTILDNDPPELSIDDVTVVGSSAGSVEATFTLRLSTPTTEIVSFDYATANGSATAGSDFSEVSGTLTFGPGQVVRTLSIQVKGNTLDEATEFFLVNLSKPVNATAGRMQGRGTVLNQVSNQPPGISPVENRTTLEDTPAAGISFTVNDAESPAASLAVTATSSDLVLLPATGLVLGGSGANRMLALTPAKDQFGVSTISLVVKDGAGLPATNRFELTVVPVNDPPTLEPFANVTMNEDGPDNTIYLMGISTGAANELEALSVAATSDNAAVIPNPVIVYLTPSAVGTLSFKPSPNASGTATITVTLKDDGGTANGGQDTFSRQFTVTVKPINDSPTIKLAAPSSGEIFGVGTGIPLAAIANDIDSPVVLVEFFDGPTKLGEDLTAPYQFTWINAAVGPHLLTARATDIEGASGVTPPVPITVIAPANEPPAIRLISPMPYARFGVGTDINLAAEITRTNQPLVDVEYFAGSQSLGAAAHPLVSPYPVAWSGLIAGDYFLTARAVFRDSTSITSAPVRVVILGADRHDPAEVAIVTPMPSPERDQLQEFILDMGYLPDLFLQEELTPETLAPYRLIIWDDLGDPVHQLTSRTANFLADVFGPTNSVYLIGERLTRSANNFEAASRDRWLRLLQLKTIAGHTTNAPPVDFDFQSIREEHNVLRGGYGYVQKFVYPGIIESDLIGRGADDVIDILGRVGTNVVLLMHPRLVDADTDQSLARQVTQSFLVSNGTDAASFRERRTLFMNSVFWLLRKHACITHQVRGEQISDLVADPEVGEDFEVKLVVGIGNSECPADGIHLHVRIPQGVEIQHVEHARGNWTIRNGILDFNLGRAERNQDETLTLTLRASMPGTFTNLLETRWNELAKTNITEGIFTVIASRIPTMTIRRKDATTVVLHVSSRPDVASRIQASDDLVRWTDLKAFTGGEHELEIPLNLLGNKRFFRAALAE